MSISKKTKRFSMPPGWEPAGKTRFGKVRHWRKGDVHVERSNGKWFAYTKGNKYFPFLRGFKDPCATAVAAEMQEGWPSPPIDTTGSATWACLP